MKPVARLTTLFLALVAVAHILRLMLQIEVVAGGVRFPLWLCEKVETWFRTRIDRLRFDKLDMARAFARMRRSLGRLPCAVAERKRMSLAAGESEAQPGLASCGGNPGGSATDREGVPGGLRTAGLTWPPWRGMVAGVPRRGWRGSGPRPGGDRRPIRAAKNRDASPDSARS
jgi:hypothetical protein